MAVEQEPRRASCGLSTHAANDQSDELAASFPFDHRVVRPNILADLLQTVGEEANLDRQRGHDTNVRRQWRRRGGRSRGRLAHGNQVN